MLINVGNALLNVEIILMTQTLGVRTWEWGGDNCGAAVVNGGVKLNLCVSWNFIRPAPGCCASMNEASCK